MSVVSTRADRRTVLIVKHDRICAEPPPDVAEAVSSQAVAELATKGVGIGAGTALQTALMQLAQRSQGLEYFRTASFVYCNMFVINRQISREQYNWFMANAAADAAKLMALQIEKNNLPAALGSLQVSNPPTLTVDAARLEAAEKPGKTPDPATATPPNSSPTPPATPDDKAIPPKE